MTTRRDFLERTALAAVGLTVPVAAARAFEAKTPRGFLDIHRAPDSVSAQTSTGELRLARERDGRWTNSDIVVATAERSDSLHVALSAPSSAIKRLHLRWRGRMADTRLILGDAW